ncbi:hypothetical protein DS909_11830 [Phaeobacter gallaeciensis]|uniref:Uncharacterized protein n=2 Tax=Roseobacteraceae TaxID=2854170 RepID=A0A366WYH2_9RHOB|nr:MULTISPECIES: hypothetical protein [Roseobacteraceae]MBT3141157.1 hypothetical protein [Falsiruegeria litorea]MBT8170844.1 hypothetical protein [Falsiruegeria litorea]RBW54517.1 hypothetical protein DS909_11830 [Phaeobacter gallaeciensis]
MKTTLKSYAVAIVLGVLTGLLVRWAFDVAFWVHTAVAGGVAGITVGVMNRLQAEKKDTHD